MWIEAIVIGIIISVLRGGRFTNLSKSEMRGVLILVIGLIMQLIPFFLHAFSFIKQNAAVFSFIGLLFALVFVLLNIKLRGMILVFIGTLFNGVVLLFHNFKMPIKLYNATSAGFAQMKLNISTGAISNYVLMSDSTHITKYLGKLWLMPEYYPFSKFFGVPDIIIAIGIIWLLQSALENKVTSYGRRTYYQNYNR